ncbi:hypothetical protein Tco_0733521 [Tanacetum coccineum]
MTVMSLSAYSVAYLLVDEYKDNDKFWCSKSGVNESNAKPSFSDISKAKACILAKAYESSSKAKVQASRSKAKVQASGSKAKVQASMAKAFRSKAQASPKTLIVKSPVPITNCVLRLANAKT